MTEVLFIESAYYVDIYIENLCHIMLIYICIGNLCRIMLIYTLRICDKQLNTIHRQKHIIHVILEDIFNHMIPHTGNLLYKWGTFEKL
jgi:hypothetical protein